MNSILIYVAVFFAGVLFGWFITLLSAQKQSAQIKRRLEKVSVGADDSQLRVKTLENKIETLELALKKALQNE